MKLVSFKLEWLRSVFSSLIKKLNKLKKQKNISWKWSGTRAGLKMSEKPFIVHRKTSMTSRLPGKP